MSQTRSSLAVLAEQIATAREGDVVDFELPEVGAAVLDLLDRVPVTRHPLGFFHFELTKALNLDVGRIRLHIWTEASIAERDEQGTHHAHTWSLASCVLVGSLRDTSFEAIATPTGEFAEVEIHYPDDTLRPTGMRHALAEIRQVDVRQRHVYRLEDGITHNTKITSVPTATLVIARESGRQQTSIFRRDTQASQTSATRSMVPVVAAAEVVAAVFGVRDR